MSDEKMVNYLRSNLLDSNSPNPSVETLLHAYLPFKYVDHTHSNAILSLGPKAILKSIREIPTILLMNWAFSNGLMQFGVYKCKG